ncbi:hypothetical protein BH11BAC2_BH11BAC2_03730 [soil metagenome]
MKKLLLTAFAILFLANVFAQSSGSKMSGSTSEPAKMNDSKMDNKMQDGKMMDGKTMKMGDGVMMVNNKTMVCSNNTCTPLTKIYTTSSGAKVSTNGTVTKADGSTMKLMNGSMIGKDGKISMIPHDVTGHLCNESCPMHSKM